MVDIVEGLKAWATSFPYFANKIRQKCAKDCVYYRYWNDTWFVAPGCFFEENNFAVAGLIDCRVSRVSRELASSGTRNQKW